jgi:hypothetical protein
MRNPMLVLALGIATAVPVTAASLPDTGQDICYNDTVADGVPPGDVSSIARDVGSHPRQDCRYGADAAAAAGTFVKTGAGAKGFDYTKIANNGATLPAGAALGTNPADWGCTRDNLTGLIWEVKTTSGLRSTFHDYYWYNNDPASNGGDAGNAGDNTCGGTLPGNQCNTEAYVYAVNTVTLCGASDWRMPTLRELLSLVHAGSSNPAIDAAYFPNTFAGITWTGTTYAQAGTSYAWEVYFASGSTGNFHKGGHMKVRLVRGGPF